GPRQPGPLQPGPQQPGPPRPPSYAQDPSQGPPSPPSFQQQGPPAPPPLPQRSAEDDWTLPPPSGPQVPQQAQAPQAPQRQAPQQEAPSYQPPAWGAPVPPPPTQQQAPPYQTQGQQPPGPPAGPSFQAQAPQAPQQPQSPQSSQQGGPQQQYPPSAAAPANWSAVIGPDRDYFMAMMQRSGPEATGLNLPAYSPEQRLPLTGKQVTIGRRRHSTGESPDVDLSVPPEDPGVSHQHAILVQQPNGSWAVVDQNSTNGTTLNGAEDPIQPYVPITLADGDRVHVGAWTTITIRRD
ncbi:FHA domain-containing protein, partial [Streptomyces sp. 150FB]|uniref:FHA domain-containing protein n=1 Tax=Streptomyces sp. 150FB TaxID=1576605 RepID=UPI001F1630D7